jgi:hypothetical protein
MSSGNWITGRPIQEKVYWYFWLQPTRTHWRDIASKASRE